MLQVNFLTIRFRLPAQYKTLTQSYVPHVVSSPQDARFKSYIRRIVYASTPPARPPTSFLFGRPTILATAHISSVRRHVYFIRPDFPGKVPIFSGV